MSIIYWRFNMTREEMHTNHMVGMKELFIEKHKLFLEALDKQEEDENPLWPEKYFEAWYDANTQLGNLYRIFINEQKTLEDQLRVKSEMSILFEQHFVYFINISGTKAWKKEAYEVYRDTWDYYQKIC